MPEVFVGPKFCTVFIGREPPRDARLCELVTWSRRLAGFGVMAKAMGNLSFRTVAGFIVSPSGTDPGTLEPEKFVEVLSVDMVRRETTARGPSEPSSESMIHAAIYRARPEINAVFHGHSDRILAAADRLGLPVTAHEQPYGTPELVTEVAGVLADHGFIIMRNHGFLALGRSLQEAGTQIESITARL